MTKSYKTAEEYFAPCATTDCFKIEHVQGVNIYVARYEEGSYARSDNASRWINKTQGQIEQSIEYKFSQLYKRY